MDWEARYAETPRLFGDEPSPLLVAHRHLLTPGLSALAVGDGEGRNGAWLAAQGLDVLAVDVSPTALTRARARARESGRRYRTVCADLLDWDWPAAAFDLVVQVFLHLPAPARRDVHRRLCEALKPGGLLMLEGFHRDQVHRSSGGPQDPEMLYAEDELGRDFAGLDILTLKREETEVRVAGEYRGQGLALHLVGRKPR